MESTFTSEYNYLIDEFDELQDLRWSDLENLEEYRELKMKKNDGLAVDDARLTELEEVYKNKIITSARWNKFQSSLVNMQTFIKNEVEGYVQQKQSEFQANIDKFTFLGTYSSSTTYNKKNIVEYNGSSYICRVDGTINISPTDTVNWAKIAEKGATGAKGDRGADGINLVYKGEYNPSETYSTDQLVTYNGSTYISLKTTAGNIPTDTTYWKLFTAKGSSTLLTELRNAVDITSPTSNVPIGISEYNFENDILHVYVNSTYAHRGVDWELNGNNTSIDNLKGTWENPTEINFLVLKNMQQSLVYTDGTMLQDGTVSKSKLTTKLQNDIDSINSRQIENIGYGIYNGLSVTESSTPDMNVHVQAGVVFMPNGDRFELGMVKTITVDAADTINPRKDIVYVDSTGIVQYVAGTPATSPSEPTLPSGAMKLCVIDVLVGDISIEQVQISDAREMLKNLRSIDDKIGSLQTDFTAHGTDNGLHVTQEFKDSVTEENSNLKKEIANLKLYQEASNRIENGVVFGDSFVGSPMAMTYDNTRTTTTEALIAGETILAGVDANGEQTSKVADYQSFMGKVGQEVTIQDDVNSEEVTITRAEQNFTVTFN